MSKVILLDNTEDRGAAEDLWRELSNADAPGWLLDESRLPEVIARLERAIEAYDRKHATQGDD